MKDLDEKILQIDERISNKDFVNALKLIDEVLEFAPGWQIGEISKSGEIYWKKLLAENACKNEFELLSKKEKCLKNYSSFKNAIKYANENEKSKYESVEKAESLIEKQLEIILAGNEINAKRETGVKAKLAEYKQKISDLQKQTQDNIAKLEEKEREIHEQVIDCNVIADEYKTTLKNKLIEAEKIENYKSEIEKEEKEMLEAQLGVYLEESNIELEKLEELESSNEEFIKYSGLIKEQGAISKEINQNLSDLNRLNSIVEQLVQSIKKITNDYANARENMYNGNYAKAAKLLTQERFEEVVKKSFEER